ncbi:MAG: sporulation protein YqfD [Eubacteriales bacterium]|nr:sporulation protein YqfD [Eubacteriales bacterium]
MLLVLMRFLFGYAKVEIYGIAPERFMNLIIQNNIVVWDVEHTERGFVFKTGRRNLLNMKPFLQKTNMKLKLLEKRGFPYLCRRYRKRVAFFSGLMMFGIILYTLSQFVWEIKVVGVDHLVSESVLKQIENHYVSLGTLKRNVDCNMLEENLRKDFEEISWISCSLNGTGLTVYLEEGMAPKKNDVSKYVGDLVAKKDAVIIRMITRNGTPMVKVDDVVKKGDVLISGTIYIYDDNHEVLESSDIAADGDIYGKTVEQYEDYVELQYYEKKYQDKEKSYISLFFMNYCFTPYAPKFDKRNVDICTHIHKARILKNFYLPLGYKMIYCKPYVLEKKERSKKQAEDLLKQRFQKKMHMFKEKGVEIIQNDVKIREKDDKMIAKGKYTLVEPIAEYKKSSIHKEDLKNKEN